MSIVTTFEMDASDRIQTCRTVLTKHEGDYVAWTTFSLKDLDWGEDETKSVNRLRGWLRESINDLSRTLERQHARWLLSNERDLDTPLLYIRYLFN